MKARTDRANVRIRENRSNKVLKTFPVLEPFLQPLLPDSTIYEEHLNVQEVKKTSPPPAAPPNAPCPRVKRLVTPTEFIFDVLYISVAVRVNALWRVDRTWTGFHDYIAVFWIMLWFWWLKTWYINILYNENLVNRIWGLSTLFAVCYLVLNIGPCSQNEALSNFSGCTVFNAVFVVVRAMLALMYFISALSLPKRNRLFCLYQVLVNVIVSVIYIGKMLAENIPGAYLTLLWGSIFFDVMAFTLPHFFDAYNNSLVPYDADHVIERFTRLLIIMFGQSIAASVSGMDITASPDGSVYLRSVFAIGMTICFRSLYFDVGNFNPARMVKNGHALKRGFVWSAIWVVLMVALIVSINMVAAVMTYYVMVGQIARFPLYIGMAGALIIFSLMHMCHVYQKWPDYTTNGTRFQKAIRYCIYRMGTRRFKVWLKIAAAAFLLPWLARGKEDTIDGQSADTDYAMVVIPSVVIPVVVLIEFLGHSRGVLL